MIKKHYTDVPTVEINREGFKGMLARFALSTDDGCPNYAMRIMEFAPGGHTSHHAHREEHEFFFIEGDAVVVDADGNQVPVKAGDVVYVGPDEPHQLKNIGDTVMRVVCTIPILPGGDGKVTSPSSLD